MKVSFYLLIFIVIIACLAMSYKYKNKISEKFENVPNITEITDVKYENNSVSIKWNRPVSADPIINYFIFISKLNSPNDSVYMNISNDSTCTSCSYIINNLNLAANTDYFVSVISINQNGASPPSAPYNFKTLSLPTPTPELTSTPSPSTEPITLATPTIPTTLTLEDTLRMMENNRTAYLDSELQNMTIRADGIYEVNKNELSYPDTYLNDVRQSINTINDTVKKDLQEYRLNIHLASQKNN